jgi:membrane protein implicated in regulation of membrane protease activity
MIRGVIVGGIALLYALFAAGALGGRDWAWSMGLAAVIATALIVLSLLLGGAPAGQALLWLIVPVVLVADLFSPPGGPRLATARVRDVPGGDAATAGRHVRADTDAACGFSGDHSIISVRRQR